MSCNRPIRFTLCGGFLLGVSPGCEMLHSTTPVAVLVRDAETKQPVPGAEVCFWDSAQRQIEGATGPTFTTGPDGIALVRTRSPGDSGVQAQVTLAGYFTEEKDVTFPVREATSKGFLKGPAEPTVIEVYAGPRPVVELVFPITFRGMVRAEIRVGGEAPGKREFTFQVPKSGLVEVVGPHILGHPPGPEFRARYSDGSPIPNHASDTEVAFRWVGAEGRDQLFVVGTMEDLLEARKATGRVAPSSSSSTNQQQPRQGGGRGGRGGGSRGGGGGGGGY